MPQGDYQVGVVSHIEDPVGQSVMLKLVKPPSAMNLSPKEILNGSVTTFITGMDFRQNISCIVNGTTHYEAIVINLTRVFCELNLTTSGVATISVN